jgi:GT2 family glycosyltransferase
MSQGAYLSFLDSDDVWPKDKLQSQMEHLAWHADIDYVIGQVEYFLDPGASPPAGFRRRLLEGPSVGRLVQAMLVRRRAFDRVGLFDEKLTTAEDVDWFCRANDLQLTMAVLPQTMARIRVHGDNTVHRAEQNNRNLLLALRRSVSRKHAAAATT